MVKFKLKGFRVAFILWMNLFVFFDINAQCPPTALTTTINGLYTSDINPPAGNAIYIAPSATVTGNIYLTNASLYNCGLILSSKIVMKKSASIFQLTLENNHIIRSDSVLMDSLSHFHNNDTLICNVFEIKNDAQASNLGLMEINSFTIMGQSYFDSNGKISANKLEIKGPSSNFYNQYGSILVRKLFKNSITCNLSGVIFMCVDSCFINNGVISNSVVGSWKPFINVSGLSENNGSISSPNFCDNSSLTGGMLDVNTGTVNITNYCSSQQYNCNYSIQSVNEEIPKVLLTLYPNPSKSILNLTSEDYQFQNKIIEIKNYLGQTEFSTRFMEQIDISFLVPGIYFLSIKENPEINSKFIKE